MVRKKKNWILLEDDNGVLQGKVDINTSKTYLPNNSIVEGDIPMEILNCLKANYSWCAPDAVSYDLVLLGFEPVAANFFHTIENYPYLLLQCDRIANLGFTLKNGFHPDQFEKMIRDTEYLNYAKKEHNSAISTSSYNFFKSKQDCHKFLQSINYHNYLIPEDELIDFWRDESVTIDYVKWAIKHLICNPEYHITQTGFPRFGYLEDTADSYIPSYVYSYYQMTKKLCRPWVNHNFFEEYARVHAEYMALCQAEQDTMFEKRYQIANLDFHYNGFKLICPQKGIDLIIEGRKMRHCVGTYIPNVVNGECLIVFIRKISNPEVPYITCEINSDGRIGQYYLAYDRTVDSNVDLDFKRHLSNYLSSEQVIAQIRKALSD